MEQPAKKQSKWSNEEDRLIIQLRGENMKWEEISKRLPGRSAISCRLHYQNFLERKAEWTKDREAKLARLYERFKKDMWEKVAKEMQMPWRAVEAKHWEIGREEMARLAGTNPFPTSATPLGEHAPLPGMGAPSFTTEYQASSLPLAYAPYTSETSPALPTRLHPMDPPRRPESTYGYTDLRPSLPQSLPRPSASQSQPSEYRSSEHMHHYDYSQDERQLPPLEGHQLPPMRLLTEPRHHAQTGHAHSPYLGQQEYHHGEQARKEEELGLRHTMTERK